MAFHGLHGSPYSSMEFHEIPWNSMVFPWFVHGTSWSICGVPSSPMESHGVRRFHEPWFMDFHGCSIESHVQSVHGVSMECPWSFHGVSMESHGVSMECPWSVHGTSWTLHRVPWRFVRAKREDVIKNNIIICREFLFIHHLLFCFC